MSQISQKKTRLPPTFEPLPLNSRKNTDQLNGERVGQTHGERRQKTTLNPNSFSAGWLKKTKDFFLGGPKRELQEFANNADRYEKVGRNAFSNNPVVDRMFRIQEGTQLNANPPNDKYVTFLDSIIHYFDAKKRA